MSLTQTPAFGMLLKRLRKRAGMTQRDLAAALGYSDSLISSLETAQRQPDLDAVIQRLIPALGLQDDPALAAYLLECAAIARGEQPPAMHRFSSAPQKSSASQKVKTERAKSAHRLPALPVELIGRTATVQQLGNRLLGHGGRLLTLVGPPGVGKTTLALAVGAQVQQHYGDGAHFIPLAAINDPTLMAATIAATVAPGDSSHKPSQVRLIELLRNQSILLLLDNLEQIDGAESLIATLLAECPTLTILATSRERLHLRAEQRFKVPPIELAPAIDLFVQRVQAVDDAFRLTEENRTTIATVCQLLDCLPLALELCASQIEIFAPAQLLAQLQAHPLDLLVDGALDLPPQHRTLRLAIQRSYRSLEQNEQKLFRALGLFAGGFDLNALEHFGYSHSALQTLIYKSLATDFSGSPLRSNERRFFLLETIRQFALEELAIAEEMASVSHLFLTYILQLAEQADKNQGLPERKIWLDRLSQERDNIRLALQISLEHNHTESAAKLANHLYWFWYHLGLVEEGRHWVDRLLQKSTVHLSPTSCATTLSTCGKLAVIQGDWRSALKHFQASMKFYETVHDEENSVGMHARYCEALLDTGEVLHASSSLQTCIDKVQSWLVTTENCGIVAYVFYVSARILLRMEQIADARLQLEKSLHFYQQVNDHSGYAYALYSIAQIDMRQGLLEEARAKYRDSLAIFLEYESHLLAGCGYYFLGYLDRIAHHYEDALHKFMDGLTLFVRMGNVGSIVGSVTEIAKVAMVKQQYVDACRLFGVADFLRESIGETQWKALPAERAEYEQHMDILHQNLDRNVFRETWAEGHAIAVGDLLGYVTNFIAMQV